MESSEIDPISNKKQDTAVP